MKEIARSDDGSGDRCRILINEFHSNRYVKHLYIRPLESLEGLKLYET
jgi:hypothetical protein